MVEEQLSGLSVARPKDGPIDVAVIVPKTVDEAVYFAGKVLNRLVRSGTVWILGLAGQSGLDAESLAQSPEWLNSEAGRRLVLTGQVTISPQCAASGFRLREAGATTG